VRHTLCAKIDCLFIELLELIFTAIYSSKEEKFPILKKADKRMDMLKMFIQTLWEIKLLDNKKYITISQLLNECGRMLGNWKRSSEKNFRPGTEEIQ
jgi:uncharacterized protein YqgQ